jgi:hypothetical protein
VTSHLDGGVWFRDSGASLLVNTAQCNYLNCKRITIQLGGRERSGASQNGTTTASSFCLLNYAANEQNGGAIVFSKDRESSIPFGCVYFCFFSERKGKVNGGDIFMYVIQHLLY